MRQGIIILTFILSFNLYANVKAEKGAMLGGCRIELWGDLNYKQCCQAESLPNAPAVSPPRWPMLDCSKVPPVCDVGYAALRTSNFMQNSTKNGVVNGDKTTIIQNWMCIKV